MKKYLILLTIILPTIAWGIATKYIDADGVKNPAHTKTWAMPASSGTLARTVDNVSSATAIGITDDTTTNATMYPSWVTTTTGNLPAKVSSTKWSFNPSTGMMTVTGITSALTGNASTATTATNSTNVAVTDDTSTNATMYPLWVTTTTGNLPSKLSSTKFTFNPSTGLVTATTFAGALTGNATTATTATNIAGGAGGQIPYQSAAGTTALLANGTVGQVLTSAGTTLAPTWGAAGLTNPMTTGGDIIYGGASGTPTRLANGTNGQVLTSSGTTTAPTWTAAAAGGLPAWVTSTSYTASTSFVTYGGNVYNCLVSHTSGSSIEADIAAGKWTLINTQSHSEPNLMIAGTDFEDGDTGGWSAMGCATITNGLPACVGSGGTVLTTSNGGRAKGGNTTAAAVTSSSPIDKIYSLNLATSGAGTIGDGYVSQLIPIAIGYQAKVMTVQFKFKSASGAPVMGGTATDTYAVAVYDVTNNSFLGINGAFGLTQSSGVGDYRGTFQTNSTTTGIQVFIYSPVAPVGASSLLLDNFVVKQQSVAYGSPVTDWVAFTPTGSWSTNTTYTGLRRRVGDSEEYQIKVLCSGAPTSAALTINLPVTIDTSKLTPTVATLNPLGDGIALDSGVQVYPVIPTYNTTTSIAVMLPKASGTYLTGEDAVTQALPFAFGNADYVLVNFRVPVSGFSSSVIMSSDAATNVVALVSDTSVTVCTANVTNINYTNVIKDTNGAYSAGVYTVPVSGFYQINGAAYASSSTPTIYIYINGSSAVAGTLGTATAATQVSALRYFIAGDTIALRIDTSLTLSAGAAFNRFTVQRISGPAQMASSESVNARYHSATATITGSASAVTYTTKDFDSHGSYSGSTYTVQSPGKYQVNASLFVTGSFTVGQVVDFYIYKNGASYSATQYSVSAITSLSFNVGLSDVIPLVAGDTLSIQISSNATTPTIVANVATNYFSLARVGN
jgi:hypothetical protein